MAVLILHDRLYTRLRSELGVSYGPEHIVEALDADHEHLVFTADCLDEHAASAAAALVETLEELACSGPRAHELSEAIEAARRAWTDPEQSADRLLVHCARELLGLPFLDARGRMEEIERVQPADVAGVLAAGMDTALLAVPDAAQLPVGRFGAFPGFPSRRVEGRRFRLSRARYPFHRARGGAELVVGDKGVTLGVLTAPRLSSSSAAWG